MQDIIKNIYDVFLSHSHEDASIIEYIAEKLEDSHQIKVWLDKWILIPGEPFRQAMYKGLEEAKTCAVFFGNETPKGWFEEEIGKALQKQTQDKTFRVIPVLLPKSDASFVRDFLELRTWVDLKDNINDEKNFHKLVCGIKGIPPGRYKKNMQNKVDIYSDVRTKLQKLDELHKDNLIDISIKLEYQRLLLKELFIGK